MNNLGINIESGAIVVVRPEHTPPQYQADPRFQCVNGLGLSMRMSSEEISGVWLLDGKSDIILGVHIDAIATHELHYGQQKEKSA